MYSKTIAKFSILAGAAALFCSVAYAQVSPMPKEPENVVQLSAAGQVEVQQDMLSISMNTQRDGTDAQQVQAQLKSALDAALTLAKQQAQPGAMDVRTGAFQLYPRYGRDGKMNGWSGNAELVLTGKDFARISSTAGKINTLTLSNVSFGLSRQAREEVEGRAQALAIERFQRRASDIAKAFGFAKYTLREISVNSNEDYGRPQPRMMAMAAKAAPESDVPVQAGKSTVQVQVSGSVQLR